MFVYASLRNFTDSVKNLAHIALIMSHVHTVLFKHRHCEGEEHLSPGIQQSLYERLRAYLEAPFLRGSVAVDPGRHLGQLLLLCRGELGLPLLHAAELFQVFSQHLFSSPKHSKGLRTVSSPSARHFSVDL